MALKSGTHLGPYEIFAPLGAGGMGEVYRARDSKLNREVALKVLPDAFARDPERLARFEREAQLLASLNHPNIAAIHGLEEANRVRYLVLELAPGKTLAERLAAGPLPVEDALSIGRQIAEALEAAHEKGIIHRDLKPANVKVTPEGKVKVLDFGLAKAFEVEGGSTDLSSSPTVTGGGTRHGVILGTAAYMSPEQARGKPLDKRTDIWSFGCVLYEALTGRQAFPGETVSDTIAGILTRDADWQALPATTPTKILELLRRCLQKDAARRLRDIGDARIEIDEALEPLSALSPAAPSAARPEISRERRAILWALTSLMVGAIGGGITVWKIKRPLPARSAMRFSAVTNFAGVEAQPSLSPDGRSVAFVSDRDNHFDIWVGLVTGGNLVRITNDPNLKSRPRWSPDGTKIAYARLNDSGLWDIWLVPALGGPSRRILTNAFDPAWSPDGQLLAYASASTIWVSDASGGNARALTQREPLLHNQPAFSSDGRQLAFVRRVPGPYGELAVAELATGKIRQLTDDGALALSPVWSPKDEFIYFASSRGGTLNIWRIAARGGAPEQITAGQGDDTELDLSTDGKRLVFSSYRSNLNIAEIPVEPVGGHATLKWLTTDPARGELGPAYSPDGRHIAYFTNRKGAEKESIWVMDSDGSNPTQLVEDNRINVYPRWAPDGKTLIYASSARGTTWSDNQIRSVTLSGARPQKLIDVPPTSFAPDISPDGRLLFRDVDGRAQLYDPKTKQSQTVESVRGSSYRWSPAGGSFAYMVSPRQQGDTGAGLWVYNLQGAPRQVFRGWVVSYAWGSKDEIYVVEGKPDLNARLWRVRLDGSSPVRTPAIVRLLGWPFVQFDVHPDRRRIAATALELNEADIGMIENVQ